LRQRDEEAVARATEEHIAHGFHSIAQHLDGAPRETPLTSRSPKQ
jgi:DNA-binding GntR family transcriptional regulator